MSAITVNMYSSALRRMTTFQALIPNDVPIEMKLKNNNYERPMKVLYLLHGYSGNSSDWIMRSSITELSEKYNLAVIMPAGDNSFYLDGKGTGRGYETFVGVELVQYCNKTFGLSDNSADTCIGGLSMGGFGAIHTGLKYPETFGKIFAFSSALIMDDIKQMTQGSEDAMADYDYYSQIFGLLSDLDDSENNPRVIIKRRKERGNLIQPLYMACGTEDFLINQNRKFRDFLIKEKVDVTYREQSGTHDWKFWNESLEPAIEWLI